MFNQYNNRNRGCRDEYRCEDNCRRDREAIREIEEGLCDIKEGVRDIENALCELKRR